MPILSADDGSKIYVSEAALKFVSELTDDRIKELNEAADIIQTTKQVSKFVRWFLLGALSIVVMISQFGSNIKNVLGLGK